VKVMMFENFSQAHSIHIGRDSTPFEKSVKDFAVGFCNQPRTLKARG
jgi:hypothetical protein